MHSKVRCRDCANCPTGRCEIRMKYTQPDLPRFCRTFRPRIQATLFSWT